MKKITRFHTFISETTTKSKFEPVDKVAKCRQLMQNVKLVNLSSKKDTNFKNKSFKFNYSSISKHKLCKCLNKMKMFQTKADKELKINNTCDPEFIIWENLGVEEITRRLRMSRSFAFLLGIVTMTYYFINKFK